MKNLFFTTVLLFALGFNISATAKSTIIVNEITQEKEYNKVDATAVPASILKEISDKYAGYIISEAYAAEDGSDYKIVLTKDTNAVTVYYTAAGEFVKEEKKS
jgi:hypothetical protein